MLLHRGGPHACTCARLPHAAPCRVRLGGGRGGGRAAPPVRAACSGRAAAARSAAPPAEYTCILGGAVARRPYGPSCGGVGLQGLRFFALHAGAGAPACGRRDGVIGRRTGRRRHVPRSRLPAGPAARHCHRCYCRGTGGALAGRPAGCCPCPGHAAVRAAHWQLYRRRRRRRVQVARGRCPIPQ